MKTPRQPKPFFRKFTQSWYLQLGRRQINLGSDKKAAWEQYHEIMSSRQVLASAVVPAAKFFEAYLTWVGRNRAPATYDSVSCCPKCLPFSRVK
jgi:hypothetical protein